MSGIQLGFVVPDSSSQNQKKSFLYLISDWENQIGGKPVWLDPQSCGKSQDILCNQCQKAMPLLLQLYCPEDYPENAFHRVLYIFCCKNGSCLKSRNQSGLKILRSQLPLENNIYDKEGILLPEWTINNENSIKNTNNDTTIFTCSICGLHAPSQCGKCHDKRYCSKEHQSLDWTVGRHKDLCDTGKNARSEITIWLEAGALFPLHYLDEDEEPEKQSSSTTNQQKLPAELEKALLKDNPDLQELLEDQMLEEEQETETDVDKAFLKFQKRISLDPDQVLRYGRVHPVDNEPPLWVASENIPSQKDIPDCPHCHAKRTFEFQITPQMLVYLNLNNNDADSLDWGTIVFHTCSAHCDAANGKLAQEWFFKQDFSSAGMGDSIRKELAEREQKDETNIGK